MVLLEHHRWDGLPGRDFDVTLTAKMIPITVSGKETILFIIKLFYFILFMYQYKQCRNKASPGPPAIIKRPLK